MEPISLVGGCATLAKVAATALVGLQDLCKRYNGVGDTIDLLIVQTSTLECAMSELSSRLDTTPAISANFESNLRISVDACRRLMEDINSHTHHVKASAEPVSFGGRVRHMWKETDVQRWERKLGVH